MAKNSKGENDICRFCIAPLQPTPSVLVPVDPFLTDMRYQILTTVGKQECARSKSLITIRNWPQDSLESFIRVLDGAARGSIEDFAWGRTVRGSLWSSKACCESGRRHNKKWTFVTIPPIELVAKLHLVSNHNMDLVGYKMLVVKSEGKVLPLVPPLSFHSRWEQRGSSWMHHVDLIFVTAEIPNVKNTDIKFSERHSLDVSFLGMCHF